MNGTNERKSHKVSKPRATVEAIESRQLMSTAVLTYHNDNSRDGLNSTETALTQNAVKSNFGLQETLSVDGAVYAQPLYVPNVKASGGKRNEVLVATQHDSVYAFDADTGALVWKRSYIDPAHGVTTVPAADTQTTDISPEVGITGTPVIDASTGTIYFVTKTKVTSGNTVTYEQRLRAVNLRNGRELVANGTLITGTYPGAGEGADEGDGDAGLMLTFDPLKENQRAALTLANGSVYVTYASHGDTDPYHGWTFTFDKTSLAKTRTFVTAPDGIEAPIWMSGGGFAVDSAGYLYAATGNGTFDVPAGGDDYGDTVLKLKDGGRTMKVADYFTPHNAAQLLRDDQDLGSGGVTLLPNQHGAHKHEMVVGGKEGVLYLIDRDNPGKFNSKDAVVQTIDVGGPIFGTPAYYNGAIYLLTVGGTLKRYALNKGKLSTKPTSVSAETYSAFPGTSVSVSSNGTKDGIVWAIERRVPDGDENLDNTAPAILHAYSAGDVSQELFSSDASNTGANFAGQAIKFTVPTIADEHVSVGGNKTVSVFGLKSSTV